MTSRDPRGDAPLDPAGPDGRPARRRLPDPDGGERRSAPVLSLEERKAQRLREREAARAARSAATEEDGAEHAPRGRSERGDRRLRRPAEEATGADAAREGSEAQEAQAVPARSLPALGGVRPGEGLGALDRPGAAGVALPSAAALRSAEPAAASPAVHAPRAVPPAVAPAPSASPSVRGVRPAPAARAKPRHWGIALSFVLLVLVPTAVTTWYLWERASPRFGSYAGFTVRTEESASAVELLGGVAALTGGSTTSDSDILYEFIQSQDIVARVDERLDLRALWSKGDPSRDPIFAYHPPGTIEDLRDYWMRMVSVYTDGATGLINIEVQAFAPEDAQAIAQAIYEEGTILINRLSDDAQEQATRYAAEELEASVERLKVSRAALTRFRNETQIVDPATAVQSQMGLLSQLESELAQTLIDLDLLRQSAPGGDPRITQAEARVEVIEARMAAERAKLGLGPAAVEGAGEGTAFADLVGQYESLLVDQEFAETSYTAARTAYDAAVADARRQSRYLAAHVQPTLAERSDFPARLELTALTFLFAFLAWAILTLGAYATRDRR